MEETLTINNIGPAGDGIAQRADGAAVFIPLTAPGDCVRADIKQDHEGHWRGQVRAIISAGAQRAQAPCVHYGQCGGCALQHVTPDYYRLWKRDMVIHALEKADVAVDEVAPPILIPPGTRRRATFSFVKAGKHFTIGFNGRRSHDVTAVPGCLVVDPSIMALAEKLKDYLSGMVAAKSGDVLIQHVEGQMEVSITAKMHEGLAFHEGIAAMVHELGVVRINARAHDRQSFDLLLESAPLMKTFGPLRVILPNASFLQPSDEGEKTLTDLVMSMSGEGRIFADLFCGAGTFTGPLSTKGSVLAFDSSKEAIAALARASGGMPITAQARNLFSNALFDKELKDVDVVVLDPPRAGAKEQCAELATSAVKRIVYVSCNIQSFAKDARALQAGGYHLKRVQPVDQFTWSAHGESVSLFERD